VALRPDSSRREWLWRDQIRCGGLDGPGRGGPAV